MVQRKSLYNLDHNQSLSIPLWSRLSQDKPLGTSLSLLFSPSQMPLTLRISNQLSATQKNPRWPSGQCGSPCETVHSTNQFYSHNICLLFNIFSADFKIPSIQRRQPVSKSPAQCWVHNVMFDSFPLSVSVFSKAKRCWKHPFFLLYWVGGKIKGHMWEWY